MCKTLQNIDHKFQTVFKLIVIYFIVLIQTRLQLKNNKNTAQAEQRTVCWSNNDMNR